MLKKALLAFCQFLILLLIVACSSDSDMDATVSVFNATILEIYDEPMDGWYDREVTILVDGEYGRMVFDHRRLEDIDATVGDVVELTIIGGWEQPDPQPVHPDSWRLVD